MAIDRKRLQTRGEEEERAAKLARTEEQRAWVGLTDIV